MDSSTSENVLEGILEKIIYQNAAGSFSVLSILTDVPEKKVTAIGPFYNPQPGERLRMNGRWSQSNEYGLQFRMTSYVSLKPKTLTGIQRYLSSGIIQGVGEELSYRLINAFGVNVIDIMERYPERLTEVKGIGARRAEEISLGWKKNRQTRDVMIFFQSHGISAVYAQRIISAYGSDAETMVRDNPYKLCGDIFGIGFKTADSIAMNLGFGKDSPLRACAGLLFILDQLSGNGHVCYPYNELVAEAEKVLSIPKTVIQDSIESLRQADLVVIDDRPDNLPGRIVYKKGLYTCEIGSARLLVKLLNIRPLGVSIDMVKAISWFEEKNGIRLAQEQKDAISQVLANKVMVVTGGPGTGKTTLIRGIIEIFEKKGFRILLCAPTGRAAQRMSEATGSDAKTIHRLLEFNPSRMAFDRNNKRPLKTDILIVDEASMIDIELFFNLLNGIEDTARLILVGDVDQLPSVGPGSVLMDIIRSGSVRTIRLHTIFRQAKESLIVMNAHRVNQGLLPYIGHEHGHKEGDFYFIQRQDPEEVLETVIELVAERIPQGFDLDPMDDIQVLSPMHRGVLGVSNLNDKLQAVLNPCGDGMIKGTKRMFEGDRVMQLRNNYELGVFNGDMGRMVHVDSKAKEVRVRFEDKIICYNESDMDDLALSYACSIHKSQGNEYPAVVIVLHTQHYIMLQRNLLYTALTRGKTLVALVGNKRAVSIATAKMTKGERFSMLAGRMSGPVQAN